MNSREIRIPIPQDKYLARHLYENYTYFREVTRHCWIEHDEDIGFHAFLENKDEIYVEENFLVPSSRYYKDNEIRFIKQVCRVEEKTGYKHICTWEKKQEENDEESAGLKDRIRRLFNYD